MIEKILEDLNLHVFQRRFRAAKLTVDILCKLSAHVFPGFGDLIQYKMFFIFVCLGFYVSLGLHILTYARRLRSLSSESSLACHNYFDTGHPFIIAVSEDP